MKLPVNLAANIFGFGANLAIRTRTSRIVDEGHNIFPCQQRKKEIPTKEEETGIFRELDSGGSNRVLRGTISVGHEFPGFCNCGIFEYQKVTMETTSLR